MIQFRTNRSLILLMILFSVGFSGNASAGFFDDLKSKLEEEKAKLKKEVDKLSKKKSSDDKKDKKKKDKEKEQANKDKPAPASVAQPRTDPQESERAKSRMAAPAAAATGATATATATAQSAAPHEQAKADKSSSAFLGLPWSGEVSAPMHDVHGWISGKDCCQQVVVNPKGGRTGHDFWSNIGDSLYGTFGINAFVFSLSGKGGFMPCMFMYNDGLEYLGPGKTYKDISSPALNNKMEKYNAFDQNQLVKFNNVRLVNGYFAKGPICLFSSLEKADIPPKTSIKFTIKMDASNQYLNLNMLAKPSGIFYPPSPVYLQGDPTGKGEPMFSGDPIYVSCGSGYSWSSSKKLKAIKQRIEKGEFDNINSAEVELAGVSLTEYQSNLCTVDSINVRKLN